MIHLTLARLSIPCAALLAFFATETARAANYGEVARSEWAENAPQYLGMYVATPDTMPENPPILVNIHSCGNSAGGQWSYQGFDAIKAALDSVGFIMIVPDNSQNNCWNVGASESLTNGGGGDTGGIVEMVQYVIDTYDADPTRVYAMGGSGGGMAVQALLAVYPEIFKAGHARAGVPAGCWAEGYNPGQQWSDACAGGNVDKTPQEWGDLVRSYSGGYEGPWPRIQINHGENDETISFNNYQEGIDEWTNVHGLSAEPTETDTGFMGAQTYPASYTYDRQFWDDECGYTVLEMWTAKGQGHSMGYESQHILEFFGLDQKRDQDPWDEMCDEFVSPGTGGASGTGGANAGTGGAGAAPGTGGTGAAPGAGGMAPGAGGAPAAGGGTAAGGATGAGGATAAGGAMATGGATPGTGNPDGGGSDSGGGCTYAASSKSPSGGLLVSLLAAGYFVLRRRRRAVG